MPPNQETVRILRVPPVTGSPWKHPKRPKELSLSVTGAVPVVRLEALLLELLPGVPRAPHHITCCILERRGRSHNPLQLFIPSTLLQILCLRPTL